MIPRKLKRCVCLFCCVYTHIACANEKKEDENPAPPAKKEEVALFLTRSDNIPSENMNETSDPYFEGYIQALVDIHYTEFRVVVLVKDHEVWLANLPKNQLMAKSIMSFVRDVPGVKTVHVLDGVAPEDEKMREKYVNRPQIKGIWFPQMTLLFQPMVANPRQVTNSIGYRWGDRVIGDSVIPISLGDDFGIYRWLDVWNHGDVQIGIESGIWSVFNMDPHPNFANGSAELVNTDFYVGIPLTYAHNKWSYRLRVYHISSHLGDEFLVDHPKFVLVETGNTNTNQVRVNPSFEAFDFFFSYQALDSLRLYGGPGVIFHSDDTFKMKPLYFEYGLEYRFWGCKFYKQRLYGTFFLAAHFRSYEFLDYGFDGTFVGGYEWSKLQNIGRKFRLFFQYHNGYSLEGQFMKDETKYWSFLLSYGF